MRVRLFYAIVMCLTLIACPTTRGGAKQMTDPADRIKKIMPKGWTMKEEPNALPLLWRSNFACRAFILTNPTVTHRHPIGGFDYNPYHNFWLCPPDFLGQQNIIGTTEQKYPAVYFADGPAGILFHLSLGENDWGSGAEDVAKALGLEKPHPDKGIGKKVVEVLAKTKIPEGVVTRCDYVTKDTLVISMGTKSEFSPEDVEKVTDQIARALKEAFPDKQRMFLNRGNSQSFDAIIIGFRLKVR